MAFKNLVGEKFGNLLVTKYLGRRGKLLRKLKEGQVFIYEVVCQCGCNKVTNVTNHKLLYGKSPKACALWKQRTGFQNIKLRKPQEVVARNKVFDGYKRNAAQRGYSFDLKFEEFSKIIEKPCYYCGKLQSNFCNKGVNGGLFYNGIDRVDNNSGYYLGNIAPCCKICNNAKKQLSKDEFLNLVRMVTKQKNHSMPNFENIPIRAFKPKIGFCCGFPKKIAAENRLYAEYKRSAKRRRNLAFNLSIDEFLFLIKKNCFYCDRQPFRLFEYKQNGQFFLQWNRQS